MKTPKVDTKFAKAGFMSLPPWARAVVVVGGALAIYSIVKKVGKGLREYKEGEGSRQEDRTWNQAFDELNSNANTRATLSKEQLLSMANTLQVAMDGRGTDEDAIYGVFYKLQNDADFAGLSAAFGRRTIKGGSGYFWDSDFTGTMVECLAEDMDSGERNWINMILKAKKIKYTV